MKQSISLFTVLCAVVFATAGPSALAQTASAPASAASRAPTAQQTKMGDCARQNAGKKGQDYKDGVKACMGAGQDGKKTQQTKMGACAKANKGKKGQEYKDGVKACLSQ